MRNILAQKVFVLVSNRGVPDRWSYTGEYTTVAGTPLSAYYGRTWVGVATIRGRPRPRRLIWICSILAGKAAEMLELGEERFAQCRPEGTDIWVSVMTG